MSGKILIIEDNRDLALLVKSHLEDLSFDADHADRGDAGRRMLERNRYDLVVLDLMLPGLDGLELCRLIRDSYPHTAILMLTAKTSELDRVLGLELGADDYVTKPFSMRELMARVKAILRRTDPSASVSEPMIEERIETGDLMIDPPKRRVMMGGRVIELTRKEYDLLWVFAKNPGLVFTRSQLLSKVWGYGYEGYEHTVNSHINRLRAKIEADPARPRYILTVWGVGYRFSESPGENAP